MVACFDGQPVTAAEVAEHLRPAAPIPGLAAAPPARSVALTEALHVRAFAAEAARRKLPGGDGRDARSRAVLNQALIREEAKRVGALPELIPVEAARALYDARPGLFNKIGAVWVRAIFTPDAASAEAAYRETATLDDAGFAAAAQRLSKDASAANGGDLGEAHADGIDPALRRLANDLRAAGEVGGPIQLGDGRWVIVRATRIEMTARPFAEAERDVRHHLARLHERTALDKLYHQVSGRHRIQIFPEELARVPEPAAPQP